MKKVSLTIFGFIIVVCITAILAVDNSTAVQDALVGRVLESRVGQTFHDDLFNDGNMHLLLCGTGSPLPSDAMGPCSAVFVNGAFYLVDTGDGSIRQLMGWQIPMNRLGGIFLTHFHSDHIASLGEASMFSWANGRTQLLEVHGPRGVEKVADGFRAAYALDTSYRVAHHGADIMNRDIIGPVGVPFHFGNDTEKVIHDKDGLKITAISVDHSPIDPAVGYRFDYKGRSISFSGDTVKTDKFQNAAKGSDIIVHEALDKKIIHRMSKLNYAAGNNRLGKIMLDITDYHTSPVQAAEVAKGANAGMLVYSHIVPPLINGVIENVFMRGVADAFDGPIHIGRDGMLFTLPAESDEIVVGHIND